MSIFVLLNWIFCLATSIFLIIVLWRYRFLLIKPSIIIIVFFHIRIQWIATIQAEYIENFLIEPSSFFILVHIFPLVGLTVAFFFFHKRTFAIYSRLKTINHHPLSVDKKVIAILILIVIAISVLYLSYIPLQKTGLYTILIEPSKSAQAREASLKLVANPLIRYSYSFLKNVFVPLLSVFLIISILQNIKTKLSRTLIATGMLIFTFVIVSFTGARSPAAVLILTMVWALYLKKGMPFRPLYLFIALLLVLSPAVLISILREGNVLNIPLFINYMTGGIFNRVFVIPMKVGLFHVYHAQMYGLFGVAAIPKIAIPLGLQPVNVANLIYINYFHYAQTIPSGLANTCYVFSYYSYFGILSVILSLFCLWALDLSILIFRKIKNDWVLLACIASMFSASISFISVDFTIALVTNGFLLLLLVSWIMDKMNSYFRKNEE